MAGERAGGCSGGDDVDRMIAYLKQHRAEIVRLGYGRVSFDLYGGQIKAKVERTDQLPPADKLSA